MVQARIYRPAKTVMQSGKATSRQWILEFCPQGVNFIDPIMGWNGSTDTLHQIRLTFRSLEAALTYAKSKNLDVQLETTQSAHFVPKCYADNFRYDRVI
jgi:hypothetical protein